MSKLTLKDFSAFENKDFTERIIRSFNGLIELGQENNKPIKYEELEMLRQIMHITVDYVANKFINEFNSSYLKTGGSYFRNIN